jgi:hypothetical protein
LIEHFNLKKDVVSTWKQFAKEKHHEQAENQQKAAELSENQTSIKDLLGLSNKYLDRAHHCPVINITEQGRIKMVQNK